MNVVTKSPNIAPFLKTTTTAISSGVKPAAATGKVQRPKLLVQLPFNRTVGLTSEEILSGPLRITTKVAVGTHQIQPFRAAHTDIRVPDFSYYRKEETRDPTSNSRETAASRKNVSYLVAASCGVIGAYTSKAMVTDLVSMMSAAADVLAMAQIEVKLDSIPEGKSAVFKWRGKPLFVRHRTPEEIAKEGQVDLSSLRDPEHDNVRAKQPEWLVVIGVCTHLGCVPIANAGEFGGYYCPCHGSHYDASGRIRKGPAPLNLEVPPHQFVDDTLVVG